MGMSKKAYKEELKTLQIELTKLQKHIIRHKLRVLIIFEGRDASGKDGVIKRITQHLSPRETRIVALGRPSEREVKSWYFQRYVNHFPVNAEMVLFNRSWYNRAGVENVMGYCTLAEYEEFMDTVNDFESVLVRSGIKILKYYLDISKEEQTKRLLNREESPLTQWKISPIDESAIENWDNYTIARDEMLRRTHSKNSPWIVVRADNKRVARLNIIRDILNRMDCPRKDRHLRPPDSSITFQYRSAMVDSPSLAK